MRSSAKLLLAAGGTLAVLVGGGAAAWTATSDEDSPFAGTDSERVAAAPLAAEAEPKVEPSTETAPVPTEPEAPNDGRGTTAPEAVEEPELGAAPERPARAGDKPRRTTFPRETRRERERAERDDQVVKTFVVPPAHEFTGVGNATLGDVDVRTNSVVRWRTKGRIELRFGREGFPLVAPTSTGELTVPPYAFEQVRVIARGRWTIRITPQS
jgi:hypothetical protein